MAASARLHMPAGLWTAWRSCCSGTARQQPRLHCLKRLPPPAQRTATATALQQAAQRRRTGLGRVVALRALREAQAAGSRCRWSSWAVVLAGWRSSLACRRGWSRSGAPAAGHPTRVRPSREHPARDLAKHRTGACASLLACPASGAQRLPYCVPRACSAACACCNQCLYLLGARSSSQQACVLHVDAHACMHIPSCYLPA